MPSAPSVHAQQTTAKERLRSTCALRTLAHLSHVDAGALALLYPSSRIQRRLRIKGILEARCHILFIGRSYQIPKTATDTFTTLQHLQLLPRLGLLSFPSICSVFLVVLVLLVIFWIVHLSVAFLSIWLQTTARCPSGVISDDPQYGSCLCITRNPDDSHNELKHACWGNAA